MIREKTEGIWKVVSHYAKVESALTYDTMGVAVHSMGRPQEAVLAFKKEAELDPDSLSARSNFVLVSPLRVASNEAVRRSDFHSFSIL